jgi:DNA-binding XRE family transcriptional regulator
MHAPNTLTLPAVLLLYRHDQGLTRLQVAQEAGLCPHCYEKLEAGRGMLSCQALTSLYVCLPVIAALMTDLPIPVPPETSRSLGRLRTLIRALEQLEPEHQAIELARVQLQLAWQEPPTAELVAGHSDHAVARARHVATDPPNP